MSKQHTPAIMSEKVTGLNIPLASGSSAVLVFQKVTKLIVSKTTAAIN